MAYSANVDPDLMSEYRAYYITKDVWKPPLAKLPTGVVQYAHLTVEEDDLRRSEFYNDFLRRVGIYYAFGGFPLRVGSTAVQVGFQRPRVGGPFDENAGAFLQPLFPHFSRAISIQDRLLFQDQRKSPTFLSFDLVPFGVLLLSNTGNVDALNTSGSRLIEKGDIVLTRSRISVKDCDADIMLARALRHAFDVKQPRASVVSATRTLDRLPIFVVLLPVTERTSLSVRSSENNVIVLVSNPDSGIQFAASVLKKIFRLTDSESGVSLGISRGMSIEEIANSRGVSYNTVRTQVKSILRKTGTRRQQELVRLLCSLPALEDHFASGD